MLFAASLVVRPPYHLHDALLIQDLVDEAMLNVDTPGPGAREVTDQLLEGRRALPRIPAQDFEQFFDFPSQPASGDLAGVPLGLLREDDQPSRRWRYHPGFSDVSDSGVRRPFRIDSRIPRIESR